MNAEPDYVNEPLEAEWYDGDIPDECRCQYEFQHSHEYDGRDVHGRPCGLLVIGDLKYQRADNCYFHSLRDREDDQHLEPLLERAVRSRPYLGEAHLWNAHLEGADLLAARLERAHLREAHLAGANLRLAHLDGADLDQFADMMFSHQVPPWKPPSSLPPARRQDPPPQAPPARPPR